MNQQRGNGFYLFTAALFMAMLFVNFKFFKGSSSTNIGITDAKVYKISTEKPGLVKHIPVVPGQEIKKGDLLVSMENNVLEMDLVKLQVKIEALKKEKIEKAALVQSKIDYLQAEGGIKTEEFQAEIQQIRTEINLNQQLTEKFSAVAVNQINNTATSPQESKISSLQEKGKLHILALDIKIKELIKDSNNDLLILENEILLKKQERDLLLSEKQKLNKYANFSGVIESVFVKAGEQVEAYAPIISINPIHPSSVVGYMVGPKAREIPIGTQVAIASYNHKNITTTGEIIGFGAVTELPELLQKATTVKTFGREVFIKIPEQNHLATGEKVLIK